jgi:hypothetical protein
LLHLEPAVRSESAEVRERILVGVFRPNPFPFLEGDGLSRDHDRLGPKAHQVHLDAAEAPVVKGLVPELVELKIRAQLAVDPRQEVEVEFRGDAPPVVVGRL